MQLKTSGGVSQFKTVRVKTGRAMKQGAVPSQGNVHDFDVMTNDPLQE